MNINRKGRSLLLMSTALSVAVLAGQAWAQDASEDAAVEEIIVVGTRIEGSKVTAALPVTVVGQQELDAISASSGDELFRAIPQMGDVNYNSSYLPNSSNSARGDIGSVNLRNLGSGNTLVLLNGRRVVAHPTSQADGASLVPTITYNTNAIPTSGLKRLEVLRDGAAALYGSDAVAGVVNTVLQDNYDGAEVEASYGEAEGTNMEEYNFTALVGHNFDRGNITTFFTYDKRSELRSTDQSFTSSSDRRPLFAGTRFDGAASLDSRATQTAWGNFTARSAVRRNGALLTSAAGAFHIQPTNYAGCLANVTGQACIDDAALATAGAERDLRYDTGASGTSVMPSLKRTNLFVTGNYELTEGVTAFGELGLYRADTEAWQSPIYTTTAQVMTAPGSNYYNPFGAVGLPGRLSGIDAPAAGVGVTLTTYNFVDAGRSLVEVANAQDRYLVGLKGEKYGFNWETAVLYSAAKVEDVSDGLSATLVQRQLSLSTPDAYNPFNGADFGTPSVGDSTPSSQAAIDAIRVKSERNSKSTLALWDFKVSKADLFALPGGDLGMAAGVEVRRETQKDDRDARVDGTTKFTNPITNITYDSDLIGTSPSPDTKGSREVASAYLEFAVPVISPEMNIPLVRSIEMQLAGRYEHFSDVGDVAKPKVAVAWDVFDGLRFRGSWAQGFKAPNLEQVNATLVTRSNSRTDWTRCEADLRVGRITSFANCARSSTTAELRSGNQNLKPEESENTSVGVVFEPRFIPSELGRFTVTADYWRIKQEGIVGLFGGNNALVLDYLLRTQGQSNPNVLRAAPTADDVAAFAGSGLAPVGQVLGVQDQYVNLLPQEARGLDIGVMWRLYGTQFGDFDVNFNAAHLIKFYQSPSPDVAALLDARAAGQINAGTSLTGGGDLLSRRGKPEWKLSASATWRYNQITVGAFTQYIDDVNDTDLLDSAGAPWVVDSTVTANLYAQYEFEGGLAENTRLRIGARNITDEKPPLSSDGYLGSLYNPYSRYWYVSVRKSF
ncbi:TonB-dependent receptor plug domain-containing protein [Caulobacter sp. NIBR2454]|uniref:TonB-dependent receptor plug domain-containing protein n=1 Tax=Caulobacter sp. NIBR2454 TaxID=3015996 RepID=UPI0022B6B248|nr:TonB-dependent receptor [Caulobacter sp. NIBR2454]